VDSIRQVDVDLNFLLVLCTVFASRQHITEFWNFKLCMLFPETVKTAVTSFLNRVTQLSRAIRLTFR